MSIVVFFIDFIVLFTMFNANTCLCFKHTLFENIQGKQYNKQRIYKEGFYDTV